MWGTNLIRGFYFHFSHFNDAKLIQYSWELCLQADELCTAVFFPVLLCFVYECTLMAP